MPIFDNELIDNTRGDGSLEGPDPILGSIEGTKLNMNAGGALYAPTNDRGFSLEELKQIKGTPPEKGFAQTFSSAQKSELLANKRYPVYERGVDLENIYGLQQPWYKQLGNGVAKLGGNLVGTFAQSLTNIPNTIAAAKDTDFSKLSGDPNGYEGTIDNWMRNLDDVLPNYMTRYERDHPFSTAIPFTRGSANWWGGKFLPNLGFMGGAVIGAAVQDVAIGMVTEGIGEIPLVASQIGKASLYLNKLFSGTNAAERVAQLARGLGKTEEQILNMTKLAQLSAAARVGSGFRYGMAIYGSAMTEAGVESRDAYRQVKEELTKQYVAENGKQPDFAAAEEIENYATNAMNSRFGINMALLVGSNTLQFGNLFKSMTAARGAVTDLGDIGRVGLAEGSLDVFEKKVATSIAGKVWETVKPGVGNIFREGVFEEGGQFAAERGTYDYFTRKYKSDKYKEQWNDLNEVIKSTTFGMKEQFGSTEGIENMLIGGLTGLLVGKVQNIYEKKKGIGDDAKLASAVNILNRFGITNTLQRGYDSTVTQAGIAKDMQEAAKSGDVFKYKNLQEDGFFDFVSYRLPSGMHDVTIMQLEMLKDLPKEQFEQMFQLDFNETNKTTVNEYVDALINKANEIKKSTDAINAVFRNPFRNNPKQDDVESQIEADNYNTFENYKLDLGYYASIAPSVNRRINSIQQDVNTIVPGVSVDTLRQLSTVEGLTSLSEAYEQKANQLNSSVTEFTSVQDKIKIKDQVIALRTRSERIAMALGEGKMTDKLFQDLLNFEINFQDATKDNVVPIEQTLKLRNYGIDINRLNERKRIASEAYDKLTTKEGFEKYFEQAEQMAADKEAVAEEEEKETTEEKPVEEKKEPVYKNKAGVEEKLEKGREYQIPKAKVASVKKIADDRWQVSYPGGTTEFYKSKEDAKLAADDINTRLGNLQKVKILDFNEDGSVKVENLKGDIFNIQPSRLTGYERLETKEEKFSKAAGDINRQQEELEKKSGDVAVGEQTNVEVPPVTVSTGPEGKLKAASRFFASSTGPSEAREDISQAGPHLIRSRVFLNNAKNFKNRNRLRAFLVAPNQISALGLDGLLQMQYNVPLSTPLSEIPNLDNVDLGMVAQVFVEEDGGKLYFVDEKGERISEVNGQPTDMNRIVFKPMPTTSLYYNFKDQNGNVVPKYRAGEKEAFEIYSKRWRASREQLFKAPAFPIKLYKFNISRGEPIEIKVNGEIQKNHVGDILIPENKIATQEGVIVIPKEPFISHQGDNIGWRKGSPAFQYGDTLVFLNNTKFSASKANSIYQVFKALADDVMKQYEAGKGIKLNPAYISYLQNVLFYLRKGGTTKEESNQFFIDTANMSIFFGGETYKLDEIGDNETKMVEQLKNTFHNLNSFTLKDNFYSPFYEYVYEDGALKEVEWVNYQSYLLSAKSPDGKSRGINETPFFSNVAPATPAVPYSFQQKYATMIDYDFPMVEAPVTPATQTRAPGATKIGDYLMDNETVHTYRSQLGPIQFTGTVEKDSEGKDIIKVDIKNNATIIDLAKQTEFVVQTVVPYLEKLNRKDDADDDLTLVNKWAGYRIITELTRILEEQQAAAPTPTTPTAPTPQPATFTPTTVYGTPVGEPLTTAITPTAPVSDDKVDIERKKLQEELDKLIAEKPSLKREDLPDEQLNTLEGTATQKLADFAAEIYDVPKINVKDGKHISWFQGLSNAGYNLTFKLNGPKLVYDILLEEYNKLKELKINRLNKELAALEGAKPVSDEFAEADKLPPIEQNFKDGQGGRKMQPQFAGKSTMDLILSGDRTRTTRAKTDVSRMIKDYGLSKIEDLVGRVIRMTDDQGRVVYTRITKVAPFTQEYQDATWQKEGWVKSVTSKLVGKYPYAIEFEIVNKEEAKKAPEPPTKIFDPKDSSGPSENYMRVGVNEDEVPMTDAEFELFKKWHAEKTPGIPFEVLDNIVITHDNEKSFGVFENGVAKFHKLAPATAPYHEVGEGIWKAFLTPEQRQLLIDEFKSKSGKFVDRASRKEIYYADATDQQAKERILDDYAEFRAGKIKAKSLGQRVLAFFRSILEFFKQFVQKPSMKEQLFKAIEAGKFKEAKVPERVRKDAPEYMRIPGLTEKQAYNFVQDMVIRSGRILFGGSKKFIYKLNALTGKEVFDKIEQAYIRENKRQQMSDVTWNMLKKRTIDSLRTIGINYNEEDLVNINAEGTTGLGYAPEPFSVNWKKYSPFPIKFLAFSTLKAEPTNQQGSKPMDVPKPQISTDVKGLVMTGYGKVMSTLFNKLSNTTDPKLMGKKLAELARYDADFVRFFQSIGGNLDTGEVDFSEFKDADWRLFIQFFQTFSLQKPEAYIQYVTGSQVYTRPANQFTAAKDIEYGWYEGIKTLSKDKSSLVVYNGTDKVYEIKPDKFPDRIPKEPEDQTEFLKKLGITFTMGDYSNLNDSDQGKFSDAVGGIYTYLKEKKKIGKITGAEMGINSQISTLANLLINSTNPIQESTYPGVDGERLQSFAQNNYFSVFENEFNNAETLEDLLVVRPELKDIFSRNSVVLMNNGLFYKSDGTKMKLIKVSYIQGERDNATSVGKKTSNLTLGTRMTQEINQNLNGNYYILLPADSATEWMLNLGNYIKFEDISSGRAWNRLYKVFKGYLIDDINLALDWENRSKLRNVGDKAKELRFFKDILSTYDLAGNLVPSAVLTEINRRIEEGQSIDQITQYISGEEVANEINEMVKTAVEENVERTREALVSESQIITLPKANQEAADVYSYPKLDNDFVNNRNVSLNKFKLSNEDVNNVLTFARMNYMIANIEFHKIIFGDPYQFKVKGDVYDVLKRAKSFGSPRRTTFDIAEYNAELNDTENKVGDVVLDPEEIGYHLYKDYARTVTFADVEFSTENYPEVNEADADSWLMDAAYKELKLKNAQWPEEAEEFHQWQMAYTRQNMPGYQYKSEALRKLDIERLKKPEPIFVIEKLKPVVTGSKAGSTNINLVLDKFAQLPIYYKAVQGRSLEKLYIKMWKEKADYGIMVSGRKLGAEKLQSLYKNNKFNEEPFNNFIDVPWSALGIQVENSFEHEKDQTWGSQPSKISSMDMFDNGGEAMPGAKKAYDKYIDALKRYHINKSKQLLKKLGLEDLGDGFNLSDPISIAETLENEFFRRQLSENVKYAIQLDDNKQFNIPFEASTDYTKIKQILYSLVNKSLISPKLNGGPKPLSSVTLWEKGDRDPKAANPELKFYTKDSPYIEILLPYKYRNKFSKKRFKTDESVLEYLNNTDEGKMLKGIAFRIPCDAQNKIDTYKIKGFLPQFMDAVIAPSELVPKSGTDFDFDKENIYLKSVYVDRNGDVKMVKYLGSEEATKEFFGKLFDDRLEKKKVKKAEIVEALQILDLGLDDPNNLVDRYSEILDVLLEDATPEDRADTLIKELEKLGDTNFQASLKEKYVEDMYNRALENDFFQAMEDMLTLPGNLERMLVPTNDAGLKEESEEINRLRGIGKKSPKNRILDGAFMTASRHFFSIGKKWVGIVATNITSHAQFQKTQVTLDPIKMDQLSDFEKKIIGDGRIVLPHNTVKINGQDRLSLSGTKTADGKNRYISERLAGYGTAVVDIVKDPFITDIIYSDLLISPVMFLERIGSGEYVSKFINQPIIRKYISIIESKGEKGLFAQRNLDDVAQFFPTKGVTLRDVQIDINNLDKNIEQYAQGKLTNEQNAEQHKILGEFLKYAKMAQYSFKLTQAINYDTSKFRNSDSFSRKQTKTGIAQQKNIFCCAEDVLKATFIENQRDLLDYVMSGMGAIMKTEKDEFRIITDTVLKPYEEVDYMDDEDFERIASKLKASFIDYILQTKMKINEDLAKLTLGNTSVANQLEEARKKYPNLMILNDLQVTSSDREGGAQTVRLRTKITDPVDINVYTERMRELNDADPELFKNIIKLSIIQGTYDSRISIRNIIPAESYSEMVKPIIDALAPTLDVQQFSNGSFQKNNWKDDSVVPVANVKFFEDEDIPPSYDQYDNEYYTYRSPSFEAVPELGITNKFDRRIMLLSPRYNSSDIQYDFVKVRRITTINNKTGEKIDFQTGSNISDSAVMNRRNAGDTTVDDVYVYKKVKDGLGNAVTTYDGKYVYKLTNVWGDGEFATEHYSYDRRSIYNNGSIQLDNEIPDEDIINLYGGVVKANKEVVPSQPMQQAPITGKVEFDKLPGKSATPTMTYAGIGSRQTPPEVLAQMTEVAKELESKGYTLNTGVTFGGNKEGADKAFDDGATKKNLFSPENQGSRTREQAIAREIHPNPGALKPGGLRLMARNTNQVFGDNLDTPVDFVLFYAKETRGIRPEGGTGQAVEMARLKGIPTINMANTNWREQLNNALSQQAPVSTTGLSTPSGKITLRDGKEYLISDINAELLESIGYKPKEIGKLLKSIC